MSPYTLHTFAQRPERADEADKLCGQAWPEFMLHDPVARNWNSLMEDFAEYQFFLCDEHDAIVAIGNSIPVTWDGKVENLPRRGWDAIFELGLHNLKRGIPPTALSALQAVVVGGQKGRGLSREVICGMREIARQRGFPFLIAPVRPNLKHHYPLTPMENYIHWAQADGLPFDAWLRVHRRLGATIAKVAPHSMRISGSVAQWQNWTGMTFPASGRYIIPGALNPITVSIEKDRAVYIEPNVWMVHTIS